MTLTNYKPLILLLLAIGFLTNIQAADTPYESEKKFTKSVATGDQPLLILDSKKGNVTFETWDKNQVEVDITVISEADTKEDSEKGLAGVEVIVDGNNGEVKIATKFLDEKENKSFWSTVKFWSDNLKLSVHLVVKVPKNTTYELSHQYGDLILPDFSEAIIEVKYGSLTCNNISEKLSLNLGYSSANINKVNACNAVVKYSDLSIEELNIGQLELAYSKYNSKINDKLVVDSRYSKLFVDKINELTFDGRFDKIEIIVADKLEVQSKYTALSVDKLNTSAQIVNSYQSVKIKSLSPDFKEVNIENKYGNCQLGISDQANAEFDLTTKFGKIDLPSMAVIEEETEVDKVKNVKGKFGSAKANITIVNNFGNIEINKE